jgi:predicted rRNA methylase YqxC with S4 and FtsJ domains
VNLERTNIAMLATSPARRVQVDVVTMDLSYLSIAEAVPQLEALRIANDADLVALVKPMYELRLATPPQDERSILAALEAARRGVEGTDRWRIAGSMPSPVAGARGARELLLHARRT